MSGKSWRNWAGNLDASVEVLAPKTVEDLCETVRRTTGAGRRIRAAGGSYSWAPLVPNGDAVVAMRGLDRLLDFDPVRRTIRVEAGMTVERLDRIARERGLTLTSPTLFPCPTLGGAISTGSHGTDAGAGCFADAVLELEIVDANGALRRVGRGDPELPAAKVALGALGVVYSITLELVPQYPVSVMIRSLPVRRVIEELDDLRRSCQFLELFWFPFQENMWVYMMGRAVTRPDPPSWWRSLRTEVATTVQDVAAKRLIPWIAKHMPRLTPTLNSVASRMAFSEGLAIQDASDAFHFQRAYARCWDLEYGVPASEGSRAWGEAVALVEHYASSRLYPVNLAVHGRFTGPSDAWLAPDHGRDTCYLEVTSAVGTPHWQSFFREMERRWCEIDGARPHWGKLYWQRDRIAGQYANFARFLEVRERWDPERVFLNRFLEREVFQLPARPAQPIRAAAPALQPTPSPGPPPGRP